MAAAMAHGLEHFPGPRHGQHIRDPRAQRAVGEPLGQRGQGTGVGLHSDGGSGNPPCGIRQPGGRGSDKPAAVAGHSDGGLPRGGPGKVDRDVNATGSEPPDLGGDICGPVDDGAGTEFAHGRGIICCDRRDDLRAELGAELDDHSADRASRADHEHARTGCALRRCQGWTAR